MTDPSARSRAGGPCKMVIVYKDLYYIYIYIEELYYIVTLYRRERGTERTRGNGAVQHEARRIILYYIILYHHYCFIIMIIIFFDI